ncbi:hypothetical protein OXIME_000109 [Oxyplasma meridianum]|uniref:Uncharacterized protein n=1 Tax=Oxyplasma meridianum TaxID=3073602 RepID=A0AAX4NDM7_9ARCH
MEQCIYGCIQGKIAREIKGKRYNRIRYSDLKTGKAYYMKENIRNLWTLPFVKDGGNTGRPAITVSSTHP